MAGSHTRRLRGGPFAAALALSLFAFAARARRKTRRHRYHRPEYRPRISPIYSILNYPRPNRTPA